LLLTVVECSEGTGAGRSASRGVPRAEASGEMIENRARVPAPSEDTAMIIVLRSGSTDAEVEDVCRRIRAMGYTPHTIRGEVRTVIGAVGDDRGKERLRALESLETVETVTPILKPFKLASLEVRSEPTQVKVGNVVIGGKKIVVMAGPCAVESREQVLEVATKVKAAGASVLRGGAFKPRTSPYAFQGLEEEGLKYLDEARCETGLPVITEVMEPDKVAVVAEHADILQIGARNVQNFSLLRKVGESGKPVLLKRGMSTSIQEWLLSAEYVLAGGNPNVILCERGIRTFETATRFTLDLNAVPVLKRLTHLPVVVDPSHGTGHWEYVEAMACAAIAAGADGLIIEVHPKPEEALSDGPQSLKPEKFAALMQRVRKVAAAMDREA
jgi:3-deoxy-7-phosphoheptulonate synthase